LEVGRLRFLKSTIELCMNGELEIPSYSAPSFYWFYSFAPLRKKKKKTKINQTTVHLHDSVVHVTGQRILIRCIRFVIVD
jgi:hypothetical protein